MKIQWKIFYCLLTIVLFLLVVVAVTYKATTQVSYFRDRSAAVEERLLSATGLRAQIRNQLLETFDVLYVAGIDQHEKRMDEGKAGIQQRFAELQSAFFKNGFDQTHQEDLFLLENSYQALQKELDAGVALVKAGKMQEARRVFRVARDTKFDKDFIRSITLIIDKESQTSKTESANLERSIRQLQKILLSSAAASVVLALVLSSIIAGAIGRRLAGIEKAALKISSGDFNISLPTHGKDEVATLSMAMNKMAVSLADAKSQILKQQEVLIASSKMSSLGEMATGIAHEINTPLAVISLRAALLKEAANSETFAVSGRKIVADTAEIMLRTIDRIARIITGLRAFARDGIADPMEEVALQTVVRDTLDLCGEKFRENGVDLQLQLPPEDVTVTCRATQISQVLLNLLNNSFDAVQELREKWIKIEVQDFGNKVEFSVTDSGHGIAPAVRAKLAQPFFTTKDVGKGTGLGLSISRGIVMDHGGQLVLDEQCPNTRFIVILPKS